MSPSPESFLEHLRTSGYHSRSDRHSNALAEAILSDLVTHCPRIRDRAAQGTVVYDLNFTVSAGTADWNTDLVLGEPPLGSPPPQSDTAITRVRPSNVLVAIELKSIMTEHRKQVTNRKRDLEAHHDHVHAYNDLAIAGGLFVINGAERFQSPLKSTTTVHRNSTKLVQHCIDELRAVTVRGGSGGRGLDAKCAIVVEMNNLDFATTRFLTLPPAPQVGDPLQYDAFIQTICGHFSARF